MREETFDYLVRLMAEAGRRSLGCVFLLEDDEEIEKAYLMACGILEKEGKPRPKRMGLREGHGYRPYLSIMHDDVPQIDEVARRCPRNYVVARKGKPLAFEGLTFLD